MREHLLTGFLVGLGLVAVALAAYVIIDDLHNRSQMSGRWALIDQALADAAENAALVRQDLQHGDAE